MPFTITEPVSIPPGTYTGILEAVSERADIPVFNKPGAIQSMWEWHFLLNVNGAGIPISALTTQLTTPNSKARKWLTALLRRELKLGETIEDPVGAQALVVIGLNKKGYSAITDVLPRPTVEQSTLPDGTQVPR